MRGRILTSLILCITAFSQEYTVQGIVTDLVLGDSLTDIMVKAFLPGESVPHTSTTTDEDGAYNLPLNVVSTIDTKPHTFSLRQNYPNPYNPSTVIPLNIVEDGVYQIRAFDILGRTIADASYCLAPGAHHISYDGASGSAGLHFIEVTGQGERAVLKTLLMDRSNGDGFSMAGTSQDRRLSKPVFDQPVRLSFDGAGFLSMDTTVTLVSGSSTLDVSLRRQNYPPVVTLETLIDTLPEFFFQPEDSMMLASFTIYDPDPDDVHSLEQYNGAPDDMALELNGDRIQLLYSYPDFNGVFNYGVIIEDSEGLTDTAYGDVYFTPVNDPPRFEGVLPGYTGYDNAVIEIDISTNFTDVDGDQLSRSLIGINPDLFSSQVDNNGIITLTTNEWFGVLDSIQAVATDGELADTSNYFSITINPSSVSQVYQFVAVYDDTLLAGGLSTLKYRRMDDTGTEYLWDADSILTTTTGTIDLIIEPGVYSVRGYHTEEYGFGTPASVFYDNDRNRIGQSSMIKQNVSAFDGEVVADTINPMLFDGYADSIIVYKMMQGFPWNNQPGQIKTYVDQYGQGLRGFSDEVIQNLPFIRNLNFDQPTLDQQLWTQELINALLTLPQIKFNGYYLETAEYPTDNFISIAYDEGFQWASNHATIDWTTNEIISGSVMGRYSMADMFLKGEIMEAIMDVDDFGGVSPNFISVDGELIEFGKQAFVTTYLFKRGTYLQ
jgi:hypothetical protein